jgi:cobalt-zinc-cadmium efflux system membrane fusion protein
MYVNGLIEVGDKISTAVPKQAIVSTDGKEWIFVITNYYKGIYQFKMVEVVTGVSDLGYTEISLLEKIPENTKICVKNPFFVLSKAKEGEGGEE